MAKREELTGVFSHLTNRFASGMVIGRLEGGVPVKGMLEEDEELQEGQTYRFMGRWDDHPRYGRQFWFDSHVLDVPHSRHGVIRYLTEYAEGVGKARATRLFDRYGTDAVAVLADTPDRVVADGILSAEVAAEASQTLRGMVATRDTHIDLIDLLDGRYFPRKLPDRLIRLWGAGASKKLREDPYALVREKIKGCGFKRTDALYCDLGHDQASLERQMLCMWHALATDTEGHTWHPVHKAVDALRAAVGGVTLQPTPAILLGVERGHLTVWQHTPGEAIQKDAWIAECVKASNERVIAEQVKRLLSSTKSLWPRPGDIPEVNGKSPTLHQAAVLGDCLRLPVAILTGTPGCLAGDSVVEVNRAGKSFRASIARVVDYWNGGSHAGRPWREDIQTFACSRAADGTVRLLPVRRALYSGEKLVFEVTTVTGRKIRATPDHPFLTEDGWVQLANLEPGGFVWVDGGRSSASLHRRKSSYLYREGLPRHPYAGRVRQGRYAVAEHRLVVEATMNGMDFEGFVRLLRSPDPIPPLDFLSPADVVHHLNENPRDNRPDNLEVLDGQSEHARRHGIGGAWRHVIARTILEEVASIRECGVESTYDLQLDDPHNFLANGFVVHNTGKTFCAAAVAAALVRDVGQLEICACAPTGKAAVRLTQKFAEYGVPLTAATIHRTLGVGPAGLLTEGYAFTFNSSNRLPQKVFLVDEVSMADTDLFAHFLIALPRGAHLLLVGDPNQLSPVGHGAPLRDLLKTNLPRGELTEIHRNAGLIVRACRAIKDDEAYETCDTYTPPDRNLKHVECSTPEEVLDTLSVMLYHVRGGKRWDVIDDVQVLCAVNAKSPLSRHGLNALLQNELNPGGLRAGKNPFWVGDKAVCLKNGLHVPLLRLPKDGLTGSAPPARRGPGRSWFEDADGTRWVDPPASGGNVFVANGEIGRVVAVDERVVVLRFAHPDRVVKVPMGQTREDDDKDGEAGARCSFDLGYVISGHKAQGSEWPVVVVILDDYSGASWVCSREWLYTAISRAGQLCVTLGRQATADKFCRKVVTHTRKTFLDVILKDLLDGTPAEARHSPVPRRR
jgi:ATP-dependent exoDNAse (exonuclease V) alpha subunit